MSKDNFENVYKENMKPLLEKAKKLYILRIAKEIRKIMIDCLRAMLVFHEFLAIKNFNLDGLRDFANVAIDANSDKFLFSLYPIFQIIKVLLDLVEKILDFVAIRPLLKLISSCEEQGHDITENEEYTDQYLKKLTILNSSSSQKILKYFAHVKGSARARESMILFEIGLALSVAFALIAPLIAAFPAICMSSFISILMIAISLYILASRVLRYFRCTSNDNKAIKMSKVSKVDAIVVGIALLQIGVFSSVMAGLLPVMLPVFISSIVFCLFTSAVRIATEVDPAMIGGKPINKSAVFFEVVKCVRTIALFSCFYTTSLPVALVAATCILLELAKTIYDLASKTNKEFEKELKNVDDGIVTMTISVPEELEDPVLKALDQLNKLNGNQLSVSV